MQDTVTISIENDLYFKRACNAYGIPYTCISENVDSNRYVIEFKHAQELLSIGINIGIDNIAKSWNDAIQAKYAKPDDNELFTFV